MMMSGLPKEHSCGENLHGIATGLGQRQNKGDLRHLHQGREKYMEALNGGGDDKQNKVSN